MTLSVIDSPREVTPSSSEIESSQLNESSGGQGDPVDEEGDRWVPVLVLAALEARLQGKEDPQPDEIQGIQIKTLPHHEPGLQSLCLLNTAQRKHRDIRDFCLICYACKV